MLAMIRWLVAHITSNTIVEIPHRHSRIDRRSLAKVTIRVLVQPCFYCSFNFDTDFHVLWNVGYERCEARYHLVPAAKPCSPDPPCESRCTSINQPGSFTAAAPITRRWAPCQVSRLGWSASWPHAVLLASQTLNYSCEAAGSSPMSASLVFRPIPASFSLPVSQAGALKLPKGLSSPNRECLSIISIKPY
ncbi:hypothetical protein LZ32DRAFT_450790 [Colletotrichum eremochloae]|nr:hypothetical protein LZ32DRAFT_450790 [Colletotrichum eremochloae]